MVDTTMMEYSANVCAACRSKTGEFKLFWAGLKQCSHCGHCMADLDAPGLDFKTIYSDRYFSGDEYVDYLRDKIVFEKQFRDRLRKIEKFRSSGDLIEVGCAYGFFLAVAKERFRARGYDISEGPVNYARSQLGVDAHCEDIVNVPLAANSVDIVVMWDTVEHLPRPDLTLDKIGHILRPGGYLFLTTGDIGSLLARAQKAKWRLIHPPTHLHYFDRRTIAILLENSGLHPVSIEYVGTRRSVRQVAYSLLALGKQRPSRLYNFIAASPLAEMSFVLNTYDIMLVVAQKS